MPVSDFGRLNSNENLTLVNLPIAASTSGGGEYDAEYEGGYSDDDLLEAAFP
jgi:hypothetical protein